MSKVSTKESSIYGGIPTIYGLGDVVGDSVGIGSDLSLENIPHELTNIAEENNISNTFFWCFFIEIDCIRAVIFVRVLSGVS